MANTSKRGFASMDPGKQREIASKGGRAAHAKGTAHEFTSDEARVAGRKGGEAVSRDRVHMSAIGREGGHSRGRARQAQSGSNSNMESALPASGSNAGISGERPSYIGHERANDRGLAGSNERAAGSRNEREAGNREEPFTSRGQI